MNISRYIDHTLLKATATKEEIKQLCKEAVEHQLYAVCVQGSYVSMASELVKGKNVKVAAVVGFPMGAVTTDTKVYEALECVLNGADEIDMVINIGYFKSGDFTYVEKEISEVKKAIGNKVLKVIFENSYLTGEEIKRLVKVSESSGADFIKTATGFGNGGATFEDVKLMIKEAKRVKVKASGGIRDTDTAKKYIEMGVARIGTSSGVAIVSSGTAENTK